MKINFIVGQERNYSMKCHFKLRVEKFLDHSFVILLRVACWEVSHFYCLESRYLDPISLTSRIMTLL